VPTYASAMRVFVLTRHGESELNATRVVNGDPAVRVALTDRGRDQARALGEQTAHFRFDACVVTRFGRTRETAALALDGRAVPVLEEPLLDDIDVGDLEGETVDDYRAWKHAHTRADAFPGGESLDTAARRYAAAFRRLLALPHGRLFVVCHEIPVRYALNAASGSDDLDGPVHDIVNAVPYLFDEEGLQRAAEGIDRLVGRPGSPTPTPHDMRARGLEPPRASRPSGT
jgi:broad specificity phosphatase PhoE